MSVAKNVAIAKREKLENGNQNENERAETKKCGTMNLSWGLGVGGV
jgi:hypothetical protein